VAPPKRHRSATAAPSRRHRGAIAAPLRRHRGATAIVSTNFQRRRQFFVTFDATLRHLCVFSAAAPPRHHRGTLAAPSKRRISSLRRFQLRPLFTAAFSRRYSDSTTSSRPFCGPTMAPTQRHYGATAAPSRRIRVSTAFDHESDSPDAERLDTEFIGETWVMDGNFFFAATSKDVTPRHHHHHRHRRNGRRRHHLISHRDDRSRQPSNYLVENVIDGYFLFVELLVDESNSSFMVIHGD